VLNAPLAGKKATVAVWPLRGKVMVNWAIDQIDGMGSGGVILFFTRRNKAAGNRQSEVNERRQP
jgi:hypothetical protein